MLLLFLALIKSFSHVLLLPNEFTVADLLLVFLTV